MVHHETSFTVDEVKICCGEYNTTLYYPFVRGPLTNFYKTSFLVDGIKFNCGEQWMMYTKTIIFKDDESKAKILAADNPIRIKFLGRRVKNYDEEIWLKTVLKSGELRRGWTEKFKQNSKCLTALRKSKGMEIVEASIWDTKWGIGLSIDDPNICYPSKWKGTNLLGKELDKIRIELCGA